MARRTTQHRPYTAKVVSQDESRYFEISCSDMGRKSQTQVALEAIKQARREFEIQNPVLSSFVEHLCPCVACLRIRTKCNIRTAGDPT